MPQTAIDKLTLFKQDILDKANAEREAILRETAEIKKQELDREEVKQLEELYINIQSHTAQIQLDYTKARSRRAVELKQNLYTQREQYLAELMARVRAELTAFTQSAAYPAFLEEKAKKAIEESGFSGGILEVRTADLPYAARLREAYGREVAANDHDIVIGGVILRDDARGIRVNESLDAALDSQRNWFYNNSGFQLL